MRFRSSLLVACILVVPLIATFSHRVPPAARAAVAAWLRDAVRLPRGVAPGVAADTAAPSQRRPPELLQAPVAAAPTNQPRILPLAAPAGPEEQSIAELRALGAIGIDCRPLPDVAGHVVTCRVPVDAAGELQRVFQATGADAAAAAGKLVRDIHAWRDAATPPSSRIMRF